MTTPSDSILAKIRALLAQAEHPNTNPAEAEAFSGKAAALMAKYAIDAAVIQAGRTGTDRGAPIMRTIVIAGPYANARAILLNQVATYARCTVVLTGGNDAQATCSMFGFADDVDLVDMLFTSLMLQCATACGAALRDGTVTGRSGRRSFLIGYAGRIGERLEQLRRTAESDADQGTPGTGLVLRDRSVAVADKVAETYPRLRSRTVSVGDRSAYAHGGSSASRADLGQQRVGSTGRTQIGR